MRPGLGIDCPRCGNACACGYRTRRRGIAGAVGVAAVALVARRVRGGGR